jgi:uncharacterized YigZ family protein
MLGLPIKVVKEFFEFKFKEKNSLFIGQCYPLHSEEESIEILSSIKKKYYDASHHCFAYKLVNEKQKYSDDGEPNGTAGIRIMNAINHFDLTNTLVVVIRYFGGIKLGVGPLGKAYYESAFQAISNSTIIEKKAYNKIQVKGDYSFSNLIFRKLIEKKLRTNSIHSEDKVIVESYVLTDEVENLKINLISESKGNLIFSSSDEIFYF